MTYTSSNLAEYTNISDSIDPAIQKLLLVFFVNSSSGLAKDKAYTQKFGAK
jgi:hypothetical protein